MLIELTLSDNDWEKVALSKKQGNIIIDLNNISKMIDVEDQLTLARGWSQIKIELKDKKVYYVYGYVHELANKIRSNTELLCTYTFGT